MRRPTLGSESESALEARHGRDEAAKTLAMGGKSRNHATHESWEWDEPFFFFDLDLVWFVHVSFGAGNGGSLRPVVFLVLVGARRQLG